MNIIQNFFLKKKDNLTTREHLRFGCAFKKIVEILKWNRIEIFVIIKKREREVIVTNKLRTKKNTLAMTVAYNFLVFS